MNRICCLCRFNPDKTGHSDNEMTIELADVNYWALPNKIEGQFSRIAIGLRRTIQTTIVDKNPTVY